MRIALLTDLHYGLHLRWEECLRVNAWCAEQIEARQPDLIVLGGDLFDRDSKPEERNALSAFLRRLGSLAPVLVVRGNHDTRGDLAIFAHLATPHPILVFEEPDVVVVGELAVAILPWLERVLPVKELAGLSTSEAMAREGEALLAVLQGLGERIAKHDGKRLFVGHLMLRGSVPRTGQPLKQAKEFELSLAHLAMVPADAYLLGHVHAAQEWFIGASPVLYNGSLRRTISGEVEEKYLTFVEISDTAETRVERVPTPATPMLLIEDAWIDTPLGWSWRLNAYPGEEIRGAEVRLVYSVPSAQIEPARRAGAVRLEQYIEAGAVEAIQQPRPTVSSRSRAPQIASTHGLADKLDVYLRARSINPLSRAAQWAYSLLLQLEEMTGTRAGVAPAGGLRLHSLSLGALIAFPTSVAVDFDGMDGEVVLVRGENGAGKSTLLNAFPGALFGRTPLGDRFADLAAGPDAVVEAIVGVRGERWRIQHQVGRGKIFVMGPTGEIVDREGREGRYRAWVREHIVDEDVLLHSTFAPQGTAGLIGQTAGGRKETVLRAVGAEHLEKLAAGARQSCLQAKSNEREARGRASSLRTLSPPPPPGALGMAEAEVEAAELYAATVREAYTQGGSSRASDESLAETRRRELKAIEASLAKLPSFLGRDIQSIEQLMSAARGVEERAAKAAEAASHQRTSATAEKLIAHAAADAARVLAKRERLAAERARASVGHHHRGGANAFLEACQEEVRAAEDELHSIEKAIASSPAASSRAVALRSALSSIASLKEGARASARATALAALLADTTKPVPTDDVLQNARTAVDEQRALLREAEMAVAMAKRADEIEREANEADQRAKAAVDEEVRFNNLEAAARQKEEAATETETSARGEMKRATAETQGLMAQLHEAEREKRGEEERTRLNERLNDITQDLSAIEARLSAAVAPRVTTQDLASSEAMARAAVATRERLREATTRAVEAEEGAKVADEEADTMAAHQEGWGLLADAFGRNGIQALEIDAAGPEITMIANDLLQVGCGARWALQVNTTRAKASGEEIEDFVIQVCDAETGATRDARRFSGGERTILGLSLSLAIAAYVCNRAGAEKPTIVRDESDAAISAKNVESYMAMIRRAARMIGAGKVLMVNHGGAVDGLVDTILHVEGGRITTKRPGDL